MPEEARRSREAAPGCAACGEPFRCGVRAGDARCWCADRPPLAPDPALLPDACLCPRCLDARLEGRRRG